MQNEPKVQVLVEVTNAEPRVVKWTDKTTGERRQFFVQEVYVWLGDKFPEKIERSMDAPTDAHPVGQYVASVLSLGRRDIRLDLDVLQAVKPAAARVG